MIEISSFYPTARAARRFRHAAVRLAPLAALTMFLLTCARSPVTGKRELALLSEEQRR